MRRLASAASNGYRISGDVFESRRGTAQTIQKCEWRGFFYAHAPRSNTAISKRRGGDLRGALILLPDADFGWELQLLAQASFFKPRHDKYGIARARQHQGEEPLADSPTHAGEVIKRSPGGKE